MAPEYESLVRQAYRFVAANPGVTLAELGVGIGLPEDAATERIAVSAFGRISGVLRTVKDPESLLDRFYVIGEGA